jgi:hypothetical protein
MLGKGTMAKGKPAFVIGDSIRAIGANPHSQKPFTDYKQIMN